MCEGPAFQSRSALSSNAEADKGVTSDELNGILQNIMAWVVATVTSILYPAITRYEERLRSQAYHGDAESALSSDSSSFCSTCSEGFTCGSYTTATTRPFPGAPRAFTVDIALRRPPTPLKPLSAHVERTVVEKTYHTEGPPPPTTVVEKTYHAEGPPSAHVERTVVEKTYSADGPPLTTSLTYKTATGVYAHPKLRSCKSDSYLLASFEGGAQKSKDATTETEKDGLEGPQLPKRKAKAEIKNLEKIFVNFKCHLQGETELILESIFQEIMSDLTQAIPAISSVTAEVFVDPSEPELGDFPSNVDISSVASDIVENMLEKLQSAVERKCVEMFAQEDWPVDMAPSFLPIGERLLPPSGEPPTAPLARPGEPMCDVAEDMVQTILAKLMALAAGKQDELPQLAAAAKPPYPPRTPGPAGTSLQRADAKKAGPSPRRPTSWLKKKYRSSLVGYIEEAISTILGYVQTELNNERLVASEETVVFLRLLDDIFTQLHQEPKYRLAGTTIASGPRPRKPLPPINVPGMVLYSDDDSEEIDRIVENALDSSLKSEKGKSQEWGPECWFTGRDPRFDRNSKPPPRPASLRSKVVFYEGSKTEAPGAHKKEVLKGKACSSKDTLTFSQDQKHQIQKASATRPDGDAQGPVLASGPPGGRAGKAAAAAVFSGKPRGLSVQEQLDQLFSASEVNTVAQEITEAVINILHAALSRIPGTPQTAIPSSGRQTPLDRSHTPDAAKEAPHKKPLKIWFDSEKKMKYLSSLDLGPETPSLLGSETREPQAVDDVSGDIVDTVFKKLKGLVYPKLHVSATPPCAEPSSLHRQLSAYTAKVVGIVLQAIQKELELGQENQSPPEAADGKPLRGRGRSADTEDADSLVSDLGKDIVASPLLSCICEMLSSAHSDRSSVSLPPEEPRPSVSCGPDGLGKPPTLPSRQEKQSFYQYLATPCAIHSDPNGQDRKDKGKLQVLDSIGETLYEMLCKLLGAHPEGQPPCAQPPREKTSESQGTALKLSPNLQLISQTILDSILAKLCRMDADASCAGSGMTAASECLDIDNLSFKSIIEEMAKCTDIISSIVSRMLRDSNREEADGEAKTVAPGPCKTGSTRETPPNRLTAMAADILNVVFAKLEGFASGNLGALDPVREGRKTSAKVELPGDGASEAVDACEELLRSALYAHAKKASGTILKAIQTELGGSPGDLRASAKSPSPERQLLKNVINLILDVVSSDVFDDAESEERAMESCGYRPTYGNFLPGGAEPDPCLEDAGPAEKESGAEGTLPREETQPGSLKQWVLVRTLNKIEGKLKEPQKSPIVPIIRNILNEIFQGALVNQLNVLSLSCPPQRGAPPDVDGEPLAPTSVPFIDQRTGPLVSEADVTVVVGDVVTTVLHKLYAAAMTQRNASENRYKTITFSANVSFRVPACAEPSSVAVLDGDPCPVPPRLKAKGNVAEDIIQEILTNLETFATYKVKSLFCPQINPRAFPVPQDKSILSKALSAKGLYPDDGFPPCSVGHILEKTNSCQLSLNKLNSHATEVARKILQGIKHELDKERESPFLTHNIVVSEGIASQIVNTVLEIVSSRGKFDKRDSEEELPSGLQEGVIERLFNRTEYRKELQFQIQDVMEGILCDIYEKTLHQNNLAFATPMLSIEGANKIVPQLSVPKSDVMLISNDIVDLVLHNLSSAVMLGIRAEHAPPPARLPLPFCDVFPHVERRLPPLMGAQSGGSTENGRPAYAVASQIAVVERDDPTKPAPDPCEENAHFITTTIVNQLESFATKRIDSLITLALQPKEEPLSARAWGPTDLFRDPSRRASTVNALKLPTDTALSHELANPAFASYRQARGPTLHLSQASLKEYADVIASVILKLIKNDLDLEIQRAYLYPNNISFQENIMVSEIVDNTLRILNAKRSVREIQFYAKDHPGAFAPLAVPNEVLLGQRELDRNAALPLFSQYPFEQSQRRVEKESQRAVLEDIFMRRGESKQREKAALLTPVKDVLKKVYQQVVKIKGHLPPFNETPYAVSNSKTKTSDITHKNAVQSHITSAANDIVESVLGEMYAVVVTSLHESRPMEAFEDNGAFPKPPSCAGEARQAGRGSNSTGYLMPQAYPSPGDQNTALLESTSQQPSPLRVGKELVQMVLDKITHFASVYLEEAPERCADDLQPQRLQSLKVNPKGSLQPSFKTSLKAKSKVTSLPNLKTKPSLGPAGAKAKGKTKVGPGERPPKGSQSKTCLGLPHTLTSGDAKGARAPGCPPQT
ncbi:LOW QUALITY PROTEIN: hypothetical protein QTO34_002488 [Cnephaeus nilssonii]|uniref:Fibrous sheath-interacting protein 2 n=1 Tax=Cnephaeus nilssonii TaxID=3371016 RepID=A0AA40HS78_CNENI|nr:LOW QUALITY PROTEIN: hypothetical protein QTO34_002488 [Eptesicus nilssonii]